MRVTDEMGTHQNGLMSRNRRSRCGGVIIGSNQNDVGKGAAVRVVERRRTSEKGDFGFEFFDLTLKLFLGLAGFLVALLARAGVNSAVVLPTRYAPH